ncbi:MAG: DUF2179 domain-containing protein [Smithellaceae bacterium]|nr:DUF2179 domain-containing protein [Smithellaceae bacterium]MDD3259169.1 DUF2179 domain-containing protein [Smithellaceae bacterium]MDD3848579.1 DUF2179 domain-containing protein [Smithellaceae bacterium]HOG11729.1 DUF2179 domain-containing protein [Smithellaceae bacterium]HOQ71710.1 DUF2179 domain-containing protein [Smithellaceae bacterium]
MDIAAFYHSEIFKFVLLPVLIFLARICDVTLDTLRIIYVSRGMKFLAPAIGFVEVLIWLVAITQIFKNLSNPICYVAYAGGFAMGNFIGIIIEEKMAIGTVVIRIITQKDAEALIGCLKENRYGVTHVDAQGAMGQVKIIFTIVKRKSIDSVLEIVRGCNPLAFYTIEDVRSVRKGVFPLFKAAGKGPGPAADG